MHRHIDFSPKKDTELKIAEIFPVKGTVLDTCCGLGYTAIMASQNAEKVYTFEKDKNVLEMDKYNPYSQKLFHNPKIVIANQSIAEAIKQMKSCSFDRIIHDPPTFKLSPELYSLKFHRELYRVLAVRGALYHYCPSPHKTKGKLFYPKIVEQLRKCGFKQVEYHPLSSGIRAVK
jgi:predicted methyltransferase